MKQMLPPTDRTTLRRLPDRGHYDRSLIDAILDEGFICHVAFAVDGQPFAIPTSYVRSSDQIYIHGSAASRLARGANDGIDVCLTVTLVDGFVLARSAFHHSINYRSVVALGRARLLLDPAEKIRALQRFTNHIVSDRWEELRPPTDQELRATAVLSLPITEASAKVRSGPPLDDEKDYSSPIWAGVVPIHVSAGDPISDNRVLPGVAPFDAK